MATTPTPHSFDPSDAHPEQRPESQTLRDVRRWRKEAYELRQRMNARERAQQDQEVEAQAHRLGLRVVSPESLAEPTKKAG